MLCFNEFFFVIKWCFLCGFIECVFVLVRFAFHCYKIKVFRHDNWALQGICGRKKHHEAGRREHRAHGKVHGPYRNVNPTPLHLHLQVDFPTFTWLKDHVKQQLHVGLVEVSEKLVKLPHPPSRKAYTYDNMWAYGNCCRIDLEHGHPSHAMYDFGVACIFIQASHSSVRDQNIIIVNL
jgi:hypothetical protein